MALATGNMLKSGASLCMYGVSSHLLPCRSRSLKSGCQTRKQHLHPLSPPVGPSLAFVVAGSVPLDPQLTRSLEEGRDFIQEFPKSTAYAALTSIAQKVLHRMPALHS